MADFNPQQARAKRPCPLWVDAFQRDTQHLEADEVGAYMLILMAMWTRESCDFPDDDARLSRVSRISLRLWKSRIGPQLRELLSAEGGMILSKRLREEAAYVERQCKSQSERKAGVKRRKPLKTNNPTKTMDDSTGNPSDAPPDDPSQQPNNPTEEVSKATSSKAPDGRVVEDLYQQFLIAHPKPVETVEGFKAFAALVEAGESPGDLIGAAKGYADVVRGWSAEAKVQQSDNFLSSERGKWRDFIPKSKPQPSEDDVLDFYAKTVIQKKPSAASAVNSSMAHRLLQAGRVTQDQLREAGVTV